MKRKTRLHIVLQLGLIAGIVLVVNLISSNLFKRYDLTDDGRHTISEVSAEYLDTLPQNVFVTVYYGGELPTHYKQFEEGMRTLLDELVISGNGHFDFQFVDPASDPGIMQRFAARQFYPFRLTSPTSNLQQKELLVLPYAMVTYQQKEVMMPLIHNCVYMDREKGQPDFDVSCALQRFEYNLLSTIYNMSREKFKTVGFLVGHGEYGKGDMSDLASDIDHYYNFVDVDLRRGKAIGPSILDLLIVNQPKVALSEREKYEIDQYIMRGGRVIFLMDHEIMDFTIGEQTSTLTDLRETNLDDEFMKWGVKLNGNLVKDMNCGTMVVGSYTAAFGNEQRQELWAYFPVISNLSNHPSTFYLNQLLMRYGASIDTFNVEGIQKTVLFKSSTRSARKEGRQYINIDQEMSEQRERRKLTHNEESFDPTRFTAGGQIMGLLLEGQFRSNFAGRSVPRDSMAPNLPQENFAAQTMEGRKPMVVLISDGEFATGERVNGQVMRLPEENKQLMINLIDIMTGQDLLTKLRIRQFNDRTFERKKVVGNEFMIRLINIVLPVLLVILFGIGRSYLRRYRNRQLQQK